MKKDEQRIRKLTVQQNRRDFSEITDFVDWAKKEFPGCKLVYAEQDGKTLGNKPRD